jgi:hypothetical protein
VIVEHRLPRARSRAAFFLGARQARLELAQGLHPMPSGLPHPILLGVSTEPSGALVYPFPQRYRPTDSHPFRDGA